MWKGGIRRGQTQKTPPAAPSTVRLGGATERNRWEAGAGSGQRARRGSRGAAAKGTRLATAQGWARVPGLVGADRARRARGRSAGEGLRRASLTWGEGTRIAPGELAQRAPSRDAANPCLKKLRSTGCDSWSALASRRPGSTACRRKSPDLDPGRTRNLATGSSRDSAAPSGVGSPPLEPSRGRCRAPAPILLPRRGAPEAVCLALSRPSGSRGWDRSPRFSWAPDGSYTRILPSYKAVR